MFNKILIILALAAAVLSAVIASRPDEFLVSRSAVIETSPSAVFDNVNDLHKWESWSPWANLDPQMEKKYSGAPSGTGAVYSWKGNKEVGEGTTTITESIPGDRIKMKLEFVKPFKGTNDVVFTFRPQGEHTLVTWSMAGKNTFITKAVGLVMNCEKMCGDQFAKGLAQLKAFSEGK